MNKEQSHLTQPVIRLNGRSCTVAEAGSLAMQEFNRKNYQAAADIFQLITHEIPDHVEAHNSLGNVLQTMQRYAEALASYDRTIALNPGYALAYNNRGITLQALARNDEALASYDKAIALKADYGEAYNNRGSALLGMKSYPEALASFDKAVALKPDYAIAHKNRSLTLYQMGRYAEALASFDRTLALKPDYGVYNNRGNTLLQLKRYNEALASYNHAISLKPDYTEAYNNRSVALHEMKMYEEALASYGKTLALKPDYAEAYSNQSDTLRKLGRYDEALASCDKAIELEPNYANAHSNQGNILQDMKRYDEALASYDRAITLNPGFAKAYHNKGTTLVSKGDMKEAEKTFLKAIEVKPGFANALFSLTGIRKYKDADHPDIKNIQKLLANPAALPHEREQLYFSLGKMYDDCSRYDEAFEAYRQANLIRNSMVSYNPAEVVAMTDNLISVFSRELLAQRFSFSSDSRLPVFIVGMPRSGTTLMASILSNHPSIATAGELPTIGECAVSLPELTGKGVPYPQAVLHLTPAIAAQLINTYEQRLRRDVASDVVHIIDKQPFNYKQLGFITMLFPKANIIHCTRHPLDTALSNYFQRFVLSYDYSFDLNNIVHFYGEYTRLMRHWRKVLPTPMIEASYEDMIGNTEPMVRKTLDLLILEWDKRCLTPHTNPSAVETASNWQVRQPIYKQSVERWRHYEKHLGPLMELLQLT